MNEQQIDQLVRERGAFAFDRMFKMMEQVRRRLDRASGALEAADVPHAIIGGNAVAVPNANRASRSTSFGLAKE